ncbi:hypothetical protein AB8615_10800 [Litorimonas sp. RW-G-Af-16]
MRLTYFRIAALCAAMLASLAVPVAQADDLPLLKADLSTGKIYTDDNADVRLFGVNYLGGMYQYFQIDRNYWLGNGETPTQTRDLFNELGLSECDVKTKVIDRDLDHLKAMGVDIVRVHILMGDIAELGGGLREGSKELDWFNYLTAGAIERGMYIHLTPITPWEHYVTLPGRFSKLEWISSDYTSNAALIKMSSLFITNLMNHRNPYLDGGRGRRYAEEPGIGFIEPINEPHYLADPKGAFQGPGQSYASLKNDLIEPMFAGVRRAESTTPNGVEHLLGWSLFGAEKTYALSEYGGEEEVAVRNPNVVKAIADSSAQFLTTNGYTSNWWKDYPYFGGRKGGPENEPYQDVAYAGAKPWSYKDPDGINRPVVAYEWDAAGSQKIYNYPNIAAAMKSNNVSVAV